MDRQNVFAGEIVLETDVLSTNRYSYIGEGRALDAIIGPTTQLNGFVCTPVSPTPNLTVNVGQGEIYIQEVVDSTQYPVDISNPSSGLPPDPSLITKQGITSATVNFPMPPPVTPGFSINYLIQVAFLEQDTGTTARSFKNPSDPQNPIIRNITTVRQDSAVLTIKAGTPATTGTQVTPTPDLGNIGAWVVSVAYGQTQITSPNISVYPNAPFITEKLKDKISRAVADRLYEKRDFYIDTGSANNYLLNLPSLYGTQDAPFEGQKVNFFAVAANTGSSVVNIASTGDIDIVLPNGDPLPPGAIEANNYTSLIFKSAISNYILLTDSGGLPQAKFASIYMGSASQVLSFAATKVDFTSVEIDTFNLFNTTFNRIQPTFPCYLKVSPRILVANGSSGSAAISLYKNGILEQIMDIFQQPNSDNIHTSSRIIFFNGTTDYVEVYAIGNDSTINSVGVWTVSPLTEAPGTNLMIELIGI